jgi:DNA-directed RNA polymerase subunit RPC12/RpoP
VTAATTQYPCAQCGANVVFSPGASALQCPYCGHVTPLAAPTREVQEHSWAEFRELPRKPVATLTAHTFKCVNCGAETSSNALSDKCQFCGAAVVADAGAIEQVVPEAVLPFTIDKAALRERLGKWAKSRWFAPSELKKVTDAESTKSTYLPHWTYDTSTVSDYQGQRGEYYYVTETYTENGQTRTREVRKTRWFPAGGTVARDFDDLLVAGTTKVNPKHLDTIEPWPLPESQAYRPEFLAGHETLRYDIEPETGLDTAKRRMAPVIEGDCRRDIGGDEQQITSVQTQYNNIMFKLMLLPVWIASYLYGGKTYTVLVNGRTGEIAGERPYSKFKIAMAILIALVVIVLAIVVLGSHHGSTTNRRH